MVDGYSQHIPNEIYKTFIKDNFGYSLLIKGDAGTGKSTLALTLLSILEDCEPIYISTRVAPNSLYNQFPWIKEKIKETNILDATRTYLPPIGDPKALKVHVKRTIRFSNTEDFLKILYERIEKYKNVVVVIDSWDAVIGFDREDTKTQEWENILMEFVRQMNVKLILIAEHSDKNTFLDYLVDGIITLHDSETIEGKVFRELELKKVRGIERTQKRYNYTLYQNQFWYCSPYYSNIPKNDNSFEIQHKSKKAIQNLENNSIKTIPMKQNNLFSTGIQDLDKIYRGGIKTSSLNMWEIDSDVPFSALSEILLPIILNFILQDYGTIIYSIDGLNTRFVDKSKLFISVDVNRISKLLRYLVEKIPHLSAHRGDEIKPYVKSFTSGNFQNAFHEAYSELAERSSFKPVLSIIGYDFLNFGKVLKLSEQFNNHLKFARNYNVIEFGIFNHSSINTSYSEDKYAMEDISYYFDTHMKMIMKNNAIYIYGIKPSTGVYLVKSSKDSNGLWNKIKLIPIV